MTVSCMHIFSWPNNNYTSSAWNIFKAIRNTTGIYVIFSHLLQFFKHLFCLNQIAFHTRTVEQKLSSDAHSCINFWWKMAKSSKKVRENSRECHNHKPQPFPDIKRKRKQTKPNKRKLNKRTNSTNISSLFPREVITMLKRLKNTNKITIGKT